MYNQNNKTIYALSSGQGKAGIAVIRISGPEVYNILTQITEKNEFNHQHAFPTKIIDPFKKLQIDFGLVIYFKSPNTFTGEDIAELNIHGGYNVINSTLEMLSNFPNTRLAEPGEFIKRAFLNNKFDLTGVEAIADLIEAETEVQRLQALGQMNGKLSNICFKWRQDLVKALSFQEALIDFSFEDIPDDTNDLVIDLVQSVYDELSDSLKSKAGQKIRDGLSVVILGKPNVGKSSIMNRLTGSDSAIVSSIAGTTRDVIEVRMDLSGILVNFVDTAGLRSNSNDPIEKIGIERAITKANNADIKIVVVSADDLLIEKSLGNSSDNTIFVINKSDLIKDKTDIVSLFKSINMIDDSKKVICLSAVDNIGVDNLLKLIVDQSKQMLNVESSFIVTQQRHRQLLIEVESNLSNFLSSDNTFPEIKTEELRLALFSLGKITGEVDVEEILTSIFSSFCIGK